MPKLIKTLGLLAGVAAVLYGWQKQRTAKEHKTLNPPGKLITINGRQHHIWHQGEGNTGPLVLISCGLGSYSADWQHVFAQLPTNIQVMVVDRPGLGWSDPTTTPRTSRHMAHELKAILDHLNLNQTPLILVGHSLGAFVARMFAHLYPDKVQAALLIDGAHETLPDRLPHLYQQLLGLTKSLLYPCASLGARLGGNRIGVAFFQNRPLPEYPADFWQRFTPIGHKQFTIPRKWPEYIETSFAELADFSESCQQIKIATQTNQRPFASKPLITLSANVEISANRFLSISPLRFSRENFINAWHHMQTQLTQLSRQGEQRTILNSGHNITLEKPEIVAQAIIELVKHVQQK